MKEQERRYTVQTARRLVAEFDELDTALRFLRGLKLEAGEFPIFLIDNLEKVAEIYANGDLYPLSFCPKVFTTSADKIFRKETQR